MESPPAVKQSALEASHPASALVFHPRIREPIQSVVVELTFRAAVNAAPAAQGWFATTLPFQTHRSATSPLEFYADKISK